MSKEKILEKVLKLRPRERAQLVEKILDSLEKPDPEVEYLWTVEARKRYEAYKKGQVKAKDLDEVLKKYE